MYFLVSYAQNSFFLFLLFILQRSLYYRKLNILESALNFVVCLWIFFTSILFFKFIYLFLFFNFRLEYILQKNNKGLKDVRRMERFKNCKIYK